METTEDRPLVMRDERGRVLPGSRLAAASKHPNAARVYQLQVAMYEAVTPDDITKIMRKLVDIGLGPDPKEARAAIELLTNRLMGKPKESIDLDVTTTDATPRSEPLVILDDEDVAALARLRRKLSAEKVVEAEIVSKPLADNVLVVS